MSADYLASRSRDAAASSQTAFKFAVAFWDEALPEYVDEITDADVQAAISGSELSPSGLRAYLSRRNPVAPAYGRGRNRRSRASRLAERDQQVAQLHALRTRLLAEDETD